MKCGGALLEVIREAFASKHNLKLDAANRMVVQQFLKDQIINVYIDDLDRGWEGKPADVKRISALLNAVRDIVVDNTGVRFRISLRSDVYYLVRTSDESTDKIEGSVLWQSWNNYEIFVLLVKRIETFFGRSVNEHELLNKSQWDMAHYLERIMVPRFEGVGKWKNAPIHRVLMSLVRKRPRDLVKLLTLAARQAREAQNTKISSQDFRNIFAEYSQGRVQDTINEFRSELPDIERLLLNMKPARRERETAECYMYSTDALLKKIDSVMQTGDFRFTNGSVAAPKKLHAFMYKINFLTARKDTTTEDVPLTVEKATAIPRRIIRQPFVLRQVPCLGRDGPRLSETEAYAGDL
jgi:hypothetical protein